ncbi:uncharacterized protein LOC108678441 isoform X3 [Hyalella azteca]|uniref:Uncharacterized protein LOC108678441 isoform X3 n=1 Tax=Hyalella azteca TaxID=294128 RepID=A0A979FRU2_HYAAZ|nr:uncharacterized protein LOC108678441 isoform X3 [Hyalella azteca]
MAVQSEDSVASWQLPGSRKAHSPTIYLDLASSVIRGSVDTLLSSSALKPPARETAAMIYYTLDPQFGALLFSLYSRNERCSLFVDPFASCSFPPATGTDLLTQAQSALLQLLEIGQHYACFLSQVRAGSVVLLVGVGSLVCWRLWTQWRYGDDEADGAVDSRGPSPKVTPRRSEAASSRRLGILASLLEEELVQEDGGGGDDEDPALIQGRYFGPDSPGYEQSRGAGVAVLPGDLQSRCASKRRSEREQLLGAPPVDASTPSSSSSAASPSEQRYLADHSASASSRDKEESSSSGGEESVAEARAAARCRRRRKKISRTRLCELQSRDSESCTPETRDVSQESTREIEFAKRCYFANPGSDDDGGSTDAMGEPCEDVWSGAPYSDLLERMRSRQVRRSLSRDPSVCSNMSDLMSPNSSHFRLPFKREDSVCSNLSDFTVSECSELSMDVSVKEEVNNTFRCLEEIEQDLDELKTSVLQMDEEVALFATKPNPYSLKMTFSDYSLSSKEDNDSLPHLHDESSCLDVQQVVLVGAASASSDARVRELPGLPAPVNDDKVPAVLTLSGGKTVNGISATRQLSDTEAEASLEWDSPRHGWSTVQPSEAVTQSVAHKEEALVSLEWDHGGVKQLPEPALPLRRHGSPHDFHDNTALGLQKMEGFEEYKKTCRRSQLLPDHSSLELDLELELNGPALLPPSIGPDQCQASPIPTPLLQGAEGLPSIKGKKSLMTESTDSAIVTSMTASGLGNFELTASVTAVMEGSTDSAIYSAPGSRSATASPVPQSFLPLSSAGVGCCRRADNDACPRRDGGSSRCSSAGRDVREDSDWRGGGRRWGSAESGFAEPDSDGPAACLEPLAEVRERSENSSCSSSSRSSPAHVGTAPVCELQKANSCSSSRGLNLLLLDADRFNGNTDDLRHVPVSVQNKINVSFNASTSPVTNCRNSTSPLLNIDNATSPPSNLNNSVYSDTDNLCANNGNKCFIPESVREFNRVNALQITESLDTSHDDALNSNLAGMGTSLSLQSGGQEQNRRASRERSSSPASRSVVAIGERVDLVAYCAREWRGETGKAHAVRRGYESIERRLGLRGLRGVRGDQYCAVRAAVFQALAGAVPTPRAAPAFARLMAEVAGGAAWILSWSFGSRLHYGSTIDGMRDCLETLDNVSDGLIGQADRCAALVELLNSDERLDLQLCEAVKLHMLASALQLHSVNACGGNVPLFAMIIFARETSQNPEQFLRNHLNCVGDTAGLEQIEMFLLGHSLKATLQVVRPSFYDQEDFICYYPDTKLDEWPQLTLIAEDDRHYNVLVE